jgi:hypothetical protein
MAAALMAMDHFNERNPMVVPELQSNPLLSSFDECPIRFDTSHSQVFNEEIYTHAAVQQLFQAEYDRALEVLMTMNQTTVAPTRFIPPCAIVGPYNDIPALELSVVAASQQFPVTVYRNYNLRITSAYSSPYTQSVFPDLTQSTEPLIANLFAQGRTDFIAVIYPLTDTGVR